MVKEVQFLDADNNRVKATIEIKVKDSPSKCWNTLEQIDSPKELSISGSYNGGFGQIIDHIKPANDAQTEFVKIWKTYHLNDMQAGTKTQTKYLEKAYAQHPNVNKDYETTVNLLKAKGINPDRGYSYGSAWLLKPLPENIEDIVSKLVANLDLAEKTRIDSQTSAIEEVLGETLADYDFSNEDMNASIIYNTLGSDWYKKAALGKWLGLTWYDIENYITSDSATNFMYAGEVYLVCTYEEAHEACEEDLKSDNFWQQSVDAGKTKLSEADWIDYVIKTDGFPHLLNRVDGKECLQGIMNITYHIFPQ